MTTTAAQAMVLASFVGDSLALGLHWIYDTAQIADRVGRVSDLLAPSNDSYHPNKQRGELTHYGDQSLHLLKYLASLQGHFSLAEYARQWRHSIDGYGGYMDRASKATLQNLEAGMSPQNCGSPSTDLGGAARIAPLVYAYRNNSETMATTVAAYTALTHQGPGAVAAALFLARSCQQILHGATLRQALEESLAQGLDSPELALRLKDSITRRGGCITETVKSYGQACAVNGALPAAIFTALQLQESLEEALVATVMAGGDSAARAMVVGMLLGAVHGMPSVPERWLAGLQCRVEVEASLRSIAAKHV
jgi:ADP-ribosylglycohydrolase